MKRLARVTKKNPCPVCKKPDFCGYSHDGKLAVCMRISSDKPSKNGGYVHILDDSPKPAKPTVAVRPIAATSVRAVSRSVAEIDTVYRAFLDELVLAFAHEKELRHRGLDEFGIILGGYKTMPSKVYSQAVCKRLIKQGLNLSGVPGFYTDRAGNWHFVDYRDATGFLIPIKDELGSIKALQLRRDDAQKPKYLLISSVSFPNGTTCGTPFHVNRIYPSKNKIFTSIIITEGILKANIIAELGRVPVVGLTSVTTFDDSFAPRLKKVFPNLLECRIAFDMDADTNKFVKLQRDRLIKILREAGTGASVLTWQKDFKGLDDYLLSTRNVTAIAA